MRHAFRQLPGQNEWPTSSAGAYLTQSVQITSIQKMCQQGETIRGKQGKTTGQAFEVTRSRKSRALRLVEPRAGSAAAKALVERLASLVTVLDRMPVLDGRLSHAPAE